MRWEPDRAAPALPPAPPSFLAALGRGAMNRCPVCGEGKVFAGFLKVVPECEVCHTPLGQLRADDAPPYFTIFIVGHLLVPVVLWVEKAWQPPMWLHMVVWLPLFTLACTLMLRPVKGAVVGWMLRLGFTGAEHGGSDFVTIDPARPAALPRASSTQPPASTQAPASAPPRRTGTDG